MNDLTTGRAPTGGARADGTLAAFLRARRGQVRPERHGLPDGGERQVTGLRRDETALLAGISTDYYVRLEQGRERHPSRTVLDGLTHALLLDAAAARHLRGLAAGADGSGAYGAGAYTSYGEDRAPGTERLAALRRLLDSFAGPALLLDRRLDVLDTNLPGALLHAGLEHQENYARMVFRSPGARDFFVDWPELAQCVAAALRAGAALGPGSPALEHLVGELATHSDEFSTAWARHDVYEKTLDRKRLRHPTAGHLTYDQHVLELPGTEGHRIWAYQPADEPTANALRSN